ncbi:type II toxin-antitoxin system PemK/MazF family toxin [Fibrella sp. HMF5335]|uniref:Type II toxin-antitoxin system PemK/MazF family toxin n=1 Tax=Fibrella rubiginis TaxID=2817060 RepID=A0A939GDT3_9BACT|nr:type II toxin-antitoxin system PemK/MazF family toxin [Fibrella rubiginis]
MRHRRRRLPARSALPPHLSSVAEPLQEGDIAIGFIQQSDGSHKRRPVLLLRQMPVGPSIWHGDFLVCGISTQLRQAVAGFDEVLQPTAENQLRATSVVRLSNLITLPDTDIGRTIGFISSALHADLLQRLVRYLTAT